MDPSRRVGPVPKGIVAAGGSDVGREREQNEDAYLCDADRGVFVVADGMGGEAAGEVASALAVEVLGRVLTEDNIARWLSREGNLRSLFLEAIRQANDAVIAGWQARRELFGMGSTVVAAVYRHGRAHVCNLGDSRAYLVRQNRWAQLTRDHSIAAELAETGQITPEEARTHRLRNQLTRSLGQKPLEPYFCEAELQPGDRLVLCSDGLWDMLPDHVIAQIAAAYEAPEMAVRELIDLANDAGGYDNISVIVVKALGDAENLASLAAEPITAVELQLPARGDETGQVGTNEQWSFEEDLPRSSRKTEPGPQKQEEEPG
ncbi:MAG: Stp1/IreP family PP2C-type Ser/Thr phosphatase [Armatimonadetes bacterium]|nr:Stp1/IreP family PP2C-type Ser/Thr phosphatase [Armatimonadota bacterium]